MDIRPKRRKSKDNPYTISSNGEKYIVSFTDNKNQKQQVEITKKIFDIFNKFELADLKELNEYDNHIEHLELHEAVLYQRMIVIKENIEEIVEKKIEKEKIMQLIEQLPFLQRRRIIMYFFNDLTYEEIAKIEKCSKVAVKYSIDRAINNLKRKMLYLIL